MPRINLIQYRRGTAAQWASVNPILAAGEVGYATDENDLRVGDGVTAWLALEPIGKVSEGGIEDAVNAYLSTNPPSGATDGDVAAFVSDSGSATHAAVVALAGSGEFSGDSDDINQGSTHLFLTAAERTKLSGVAAGAQVNAVASVAGKTGAVMLAKVDVGLGNVDNTADASKAFAASQVTSGTLAEARIPTLAQSKVANLSTDLAARVPTTRAVNSKPLSADITLDATDVSAVADATAGGSAFHGAFNYEDRPAGLINDGRLHWGIVLDGMPE